MQDADPFVGKRTQGRLVGFADAALLAIEGGGPERVRDSERGPFDEGLSQELWALPTPVHPAGVAAAFGDRSDAAVALQIIRLGEALALLAEGGKQARSEDRPGSGEAVEDAEVGMRRRAFGDLVVESLDRMQRGAQLLDERLDEQSAGFDDGGIVRQRSGALDRIDALFDELFLTDVVLMEETLERGAPRLMSGFERGPALQEVAEEDAVLVGEPLQRLGKIVLQGRC